MESKKQFKEKNNSLIKENSIEESKEDPALIRFESQFNFSPQTEAAITENISQQALENIKHIFNKTQTIRKVADVKHQEIQAQFKELRERLNNTSQCLNRMKKGIDNVKFSYQKKVSELHKNLSPPGDNLDAQRLPESREEMGKKMEEIKDKIEKIQEKFNEEKEKQINVTLNYKDAFENVSVVLERIEKGEYSSLNL